MCHRRGDQTQAAAGRLCRRGRAQRGQKALQIAHARGDLRGDLLQQLARCPIQVEAMTPGKKTLKSLKSFINFTSLFNFFLFSLFYLVNCDLRPTGSKHVCF